MDKFPPIIFIGMHRSGTSLMGRLLEGLGLFSGNQKDENNEAIFFQKLNYWIMSQCGARWDVPEATNYLWGNDELQIWVERYVRNYLNSPRSMFFLGPWHYINCTRIHSLNLPWGWKDPCNTITLPLWLRIFPDAKVVYIVRHGVDVAESLIVRSKKGFEAAVQKYQKYKSVVYIRPKRRGFLESPRCASLAGGFSLWKEYNLQAKKNVRNIPEDRVHFIHYEDLLEDPNERLYNIARFCGLEVTKDQVKAITMKIDDSRAYSYMNNEELSKFASAHQADLEIFGYK